VIDPKEGGWFMDGVLWGMIISLGIMTIALVFWFSEKK
jgi:hypothetical protein